MCIAIFGEQKDFEEIKKYMPLCDVERYDNTEELIPAVFEKNIEAVFVLMNNAAGMEGVIAARRHKEIPVAWFSNDRGFAAQAYRLNTDYFTVKPLSEEKIKQAFKRCGLEKILNETEKLA